MADRKRFAPEAVFSSSPVEGGNVSSYTWSALRKPPASSTVANPSVLYNQPGSYSVSLTLSNPNGNSDLVVQHYIKVQSAQTAVDATALVQHLRTPPCSVRTGRPFGAGDYLNLEIDKTVGYQDSSCSSSTIFLPPKADRRALFPIARRALHHSAQPAVPLCLCHQGEQRQRCPEVYGFQRSWVRTWVPTKYHQHFQPDHGRLEDRSIHAFLGCRLEGVQREPQQLRRRQ